MNRKKRKGSVSNKGFTLVELLVSMVILSIVILIIASFLSLGSRSYSKANQEITRQMETQTVMNQLEDLIIKSYWVKLIDVSTEEKALILYSQDDTSIVICNNQDNNLYLVEGTPAALSDLSSITYTREENLMAENVHDLKLLLNEASMITKKEIQLELDFRFEGEDDRLVHTIHFRNQLVKPTDTP